MLESKYFFNQLNFFVVALFKSYFQSLKAVLFRILQIVFLEQIGSNLTYFNLVYSPAHVRELLFFFVPFLFNFIINFLRDAS